MSEASARMRWDPYVLARGDEFDAFWRAHLARRSRRLLLVIGMGFDSRTVEAAARLRALGADADVWLLAFENGFDDSPTRTTLTASNRGRLEWLFGSDRIRAVPVRIGGAAGGMATSRNTRDALKGAGAFGTYDDVVVDVSAMPRMVAMATVVKFLHDLDQSAKSGGPDVNLHVVTAESVDADLAFARGTLSEEVTSLHGFSGHLTAQSSVRTPRVWFPILGEGQRDRLDKIQTSLNPDEICPVIPFPSVDPRRGDRIIDEHREILFDEFRVEPKNILLASEYNPFEAYKQVFSAIDRYAQALDELGGCKAFVSPLSSKLLSMGGLLACYDHAVVKAGSRRVKIGIPYVETAMYGDPAPGGEVRAELHSMWIRGEWET